MERILLATDLDEQYASNVAAFALAIADNFQAHLTVYHAFGQPHPSLALGTDAPELREGRVISAMRRLIESVQGPSFLEIPIDYAADIDYPGDGIISRASEGNYDLVVIGLREPRDGRPQFSSLAYRLLRETPTAILAIPPQASFHGVGEIVFATDMDHEDEVVLEQLQEWRQRMSADLYVVHIWDTQEDVEKAREVMGKWRERYASRPRLHFELMEGDFSADIGDYVRQRGGDMLVTQSHRRGLFARLFGYSATLDIAHTTEVPLLVMRGED